LWNVESIEREGPEAVRVKITCNGAESAIQHPGPGGYCAFLLPTEPKIQRTYSVISRPDAPAIEFLVKNVRGGVASRFFHTELQPGQAIEMVDSGNHMWQKKWEEEPQHFIGFAGGAGISPIYSCMIHALGLRKPKHQCSLYFSSTSERRELLRNELSGISSHPRGTVFKLHTERITTESSSRRIDRHQVERWLRMRSDFATATYLICGPHGLMEEVHAALDVLGIPHAQRHTEYFTSRTIPGLEEQLAGSRKAVRPSCQVEIEQDSGVHSFEMYGEGKSILKAAHQAGIDVPSSCSGGICLSCQAQILEGEVQRYGISGLTEDEKAQGMVLCCRAQPKTDRLTLRLVNS
jgi:ring-1,2-phenylacetyl-CoA epoxidase subunit PaaE